MLDFLGLSISLHFSPSESVVRRVIQLHFCIAGFQVITFKHNRQIQPTYMHTNFHLLIHVIHFISSELEMLNAFFRFLFVNSEPDIKAPLNCAGHVVHCTFHYMEMLHHVQLKSTFTTFKMHSNRKSQIITVFHKFSNVGSILECFAQRNYDRKCVIN